MIVFLKLIGLVAVAVSGWGLGRARPTLNLFVLVLTLFAAVTAHAGMQDVFFEERMDAVLGDPRKDAGPGVVVPIAAAETVGLWVPFLVLPWAPVRARVWAALYAIGAAILAAVLHYFPFDVPLVDKEFIAIHGPLYLPAWFVCLPIAGLAFFMGWTKSFRERVDADVDLPELR